MKKSGAHRRFLGCGARLRWTMVGLATLGWCACASHGGSPESSSDAAVDAVVEETGRGESAAAFDGAPGDAASEEANVRSTEPDSGPAQNDASSMSPGDAALKQSPRPFGS